MAALVLFLIVMLMVTAASLVSKWMARRATVKVIDRFCQYNALDARGARTQEELGLNPPSLVERLTKMRDYKPDVVQLLKILKVVRTRTDGKMYLVEKNLYPGFRCRDDGQESG